MSRDYSAEDQPAVETVYALRGIEKALYRIADSLDRLAAPDPGDAEYVPTETISVPPDSATGGGHIVPHWLRAEFGLPPLTKNER